MAAPTAEVLFSSENATVLEQFQRYFLERTFDTALLLDWGLPFGLVLLALIAAMLFLVLRSRHKAYVPQDWIVNPHEIRAVLQRALDQRSKFELQFPAWRDERRPSLRCSGVRLEGLFLTLVLHGVPKYVAHWAGKEVECFFHAQDHDKPMFHAFAGRIKDVMVQPDACQVRLTIPDRLECRQKRAYLRIAPPEEFLLGAALWRGEELPAEELRAEIQTWPKPSIVYLPTISAGFAVTDISAGGVRLYIPRRYLAQKNNAVCIGDTVILMLDLWDPDHSARMRFWILSRIQMAVLDYETQGLDAGLQFLSWAKPRDAECSSNLEWLRMSHSGEIESLGNWIMRRHLELFREAEPTLP